MQAPSFDSAVAGTERTFFGPGHRHRAPTARMQAAQRAARQLLLCCLASSDRLLSFNTDKMTGFAK